MELWDDGKFFQTKNYIFALEKDENQYHESLRRVPWESLITILLYAFSDDRGKSYSHVSVDDDSRKNKHRRQRQQKRRRQDGGQRGQHDGEDSPTSGTSETFWSNGFNAAASIPSGSYITTTTMAILFMMQSLSISFAHDV